METMSSNAPHERELRRGMPSGESLVQDSPLQASDFDAKVNVGSTLVDVHEIGPALFGQSTPSVRKIRDMTKQGLLVSLKIGRHVRYDVRLSREALYRHCLIQGKSGNGRKR